MWRVISFSLLYNSSKPIWFLTGIKTDNFYLFSKKWGYKSINYCTVITRKLQYRKTTLRQNRRTFVVVTKQIVLTSKLLNHLLS